MHDRNLKLTLEYDGTEFSGWQVQPDERTVQGDLEAWVRRICRRGLSVGADGVLLVEPVAPGAADQREGLRCVQ